MVSISQSAQQLLQLILVPVESLVNYEYSGVNSLTDLDSDSIRADLLLRPSDQRDH